MSKTLPEAIERLAQELVDSATNKDWDNLARLNEKVDVLLRRLQPIPKKLQTKVDVLHQAHQQACALAQEGYDRLSSRIDDLRDNQEGLRAYEQSGGVA